MNQLLATPEPRCLTLNGTQYVGVTSAMQLVKWILREPDEYVGMPKAQIRMHQLEGTACHAACLDYLAYTFHLLPDWTQPEWPGPTVHIDARRWQNVLHAALMNWMAFVKKYEVEPIGIEQEGTSKTYGLVGHVDLYCTMKWNGRRIKAVVDLKFVAALLESHRLQARCYGRLDQFRDAQMGFLFHSNRTTGEWVLGNVNLTEGLADVLAVSHAAKMWAWAEGRRA